MPFSNCSSAERSDVTGEFSDGRIGGEFVSRTNTTPDINNVCELEGKLWSDATPDINIVKIVAKLLGLPLDFHDGTKR
jgi:hypothetical protein